MEELSKAQEPKVNKQDLYVSKEEFAQYLEVQQSGAYNMLDPMARQITTLDKKQWFHIVKNYAYFKKLYAE
jgi:hypothetical protein